MNGTNYMEFYIGEFDDGINYWNEGSFYLSHDVYKSFHSAFRKVKSDYNDYNVNKFESPELNILKEILTKFEMKLQSSTLTHAEGEINSKLMSVLNELKSIVNKAQESNKPLWVLGM